MEFCLQLQKVPLLAPLSRHIKKTELISAAYYTV